MALMAAIEYEAEQLPKFTHLFTLVDDGPCAFRMGLPKVVVLGDDRGLLS